MIRKKIDCILNELPEEELEHVYQAVLGVKQEYDYKQNLINKGVTLDIYHTDSEKLIQRWEAAFAGSIKEEVKAKIYYEQFKWHLFSYEKIPCLKEEEARTAFDAQRKGNLYMMYERFPIVYVYENAMNVTSEDFNSQSDIYIFDDSFSWTYVHTHEEMCGPYFLKLAD
ncbi:DUF4275 family protein [Lysinibacillus sp. KU-BSD001]|uniref:DUF4275 family protein n=1 Tax=Lysinibacillus sp. KU-BSD001 TaxID=3141328 RepID=UPI0036ED3598